MLDVYGKVIDDGSQYAPAVRAQLAGFLAMLTYELPEKQRQRSSQEIRIYLRKLASCKEAGCAESWCRPIERLSYLWATAAKTVFGLIELAWQEHYGKSESGEELAKWVFNPKRDKDLPLRPELMSVEDRQAIISAFEESGDQQSDVLSMLGRNFIKLVLLDHKLVSRLTDFLEKSDISLAKSFAGGLDISSWRWLCLPSLKPIYERMLKEEDGVVTEGIIWDMACAFLLELEEESMFLNILPNLNDSSKGNCISILCKLYHWLGAKNVYWSKVRSLWEQAANLPAEHNKYYLLAFSISLFSKDDGDDSRTQMPESINTLEPLLLKTVAVLPRWGDERSAVISYLSKQSAYAPEPAMRLFFRVC